MYWIKVRFCGGIYFLKEGKHVYQIANNPEERTAWTYERATQIVAFLHDSIKELQSIDLVLVGSE